MPVTIDDVEKVAALARLSFSAPEKEKMTALLNRILDYMDKLNELDTKDAEPTSHVLPIKNVFREDEMKPSFPREELLGNAPSRDERYFRVPRVIE